MNHTSPSEHSHTFVYSPFFEVVFFPCVTHSRVLPKRIKILRQREARTQIVCSWFFFVKETKVKRSDAKRETRHENKFIFRYSGYVHSWNSHSACDEDMVCFLAVPALFMLIIVMWHSIHAHRTHILGIATQFWWQSFWLQAHTNVHIRKHDYNACIAECRRFVIFNL